MATAFNNPLITHKFTADPTAIEHEGKIYLFTGHDEAAEELEEYRMNEWLCFTSENMIDWQEEAVPLRPTDFSWAKGDAFASKVISHNGKFYWYVALSPAGIAGKAIGVAVSDHPAGPYTDAKGSALIDNKTTGREGDNLFNLDPTAIKDKNGSAHIIWGNSKCFYAKLNADMISIEGEINIIDLPGFSEGASIHQYQNQYYLLYGAGKPEKIAYAMSSEPGGPWEYKGIICEEAENSETNRPAVLQFNNKNFFFYHDGTLPEGSSYRRSVCADLLFYNDDGTIRKIIMTAKGVQPV